MKRTNEQMSHCWNEIFQSRNSAGSLRFQLNTSVLKSSDLKRLQSVSLKKHWTCDFKCSFNVFAHFLQKNMMKILFFFCLWDTIVNEWLQNGDHMTAAFSRGKEKNKGSGLKIILKWWIWTFNRHESKPKRKWKNILRVCRFPEAYSKSSRDERSSLQEWSGRNF